MKDPNTIKVYYPDKAVMTMGYETKGDLIEALKKEAEHLLKRYRYKQPLPLKIVVAIDRRKECLS